jgi:hypothetical protein
MNLDVDLGNANPARYALGVKQTCNLLMFK